MPLSTRERGGAFYGRRKGKRLRHGQEERVADLLPRLRVPLVPNGTIDCRGLFPFAPETLTLEIGFGGGEHLAHLARRAPSGGFIGCEPFVNGMAKMLAAIEAENFANVRLWDRDASELLPALPDSCLDAVYLLYADPWPKRRQRKRRFVSAESLAQIARVLRTGGIFRFASDIDDYVGWTLAHAAREPRLRWTAERAADWREPYPEWPGTRYEAKAFREGRVPSYLTFERI